MASRELEVPWEEEYVLANDKESALRKLIPNTEDYYFYYILHNLTAYGYPLNDTTNNLLKEYKRQFVHSTRLKKLQNRISMMKLNAELENNKKISVRNKQICHHFETQHKLIILHYRKIHVLNWKNNFQCIEIQHHQKLYPLEK